MSSEASVDRLPMSRPPSSQPSAVTEDRHDLAGGGESKPSVVPAALARSDTRERFIRDDAIGMPRQLASGCARRVLERTGDVLPMIAPGFVEPPRLAASLQSGERSRVLDLDGAAAAQ